LDKPVGLKLKLQIIIFIKNTIPMSLLNQGNKKGKKKEDKKKSATAAGSKFMAKPKSGFVSKQQNTGSQRGS
jgi:hypothetical protein